MPETLGVTEEEDIGGGGPFEKILGKGVHREGRKVQSGPGPALVSPFHIMAHTGNICPGMR